VPTVISLCAFAVALTAYLRQRRREDFALARELHNDLVAGKVAQARDLLGTLLHDPEGIDDGDLPRLRDAYFTVLWCFERIYAGRSVIADGWYWRNRPLDFLDRLIGWHVAYWATNADVAKLLLQERLGNEVQDEHSRYGLKGLHAALQRGRQAEAARV
jgi:hypothetical protein